MKKRTILFLILFVSVCYILFAIIEFHISYNQFVSNFKNCKYTQQKIFKNVYFANYKTKSNCPVAFSQLINNKCKIVITNKCKNFMLCYLVESCNCKTWNWSIPYWLQDFYCNIYGSLKYIFIHIL